ncbi:MAG: hypothetical protein MI717_11820 [Spirochaetales bacterium]|nr:hypothetical protein [Spirochaetales bacterium]
MMMLIYTIQVLTGQEKRVLKQLENLFCRELGESHDISVHFPQRQLMQKMSGKMVHKLQPVFPGYLFLSSQDFPSKLFRLITRLPDVFYFLPRQNSPQPLSLEDVDLIKPLLLSPKGITSLIDVHFDEDDRIVVHHGPFSGYEGRIIKVDRRKRRMRVALSLYGDGLHIDFGYRDVGPSTLKHP